ncbi:MAG: 23S rRNA pseudouridine(1911/1915/1917) synthase RluD [Pseudomonadota bacterium]
MPGHCDGMRLDQAAARIFPDFSRARLQSWIKSGALRIDGEPTTQRTKVIAGSVLELHVELEPEVAWSGESLPLDILYEDEHILILNKPPGLVVHPGAGNPSGTLVNALLHHRPSLESLPRAGLVHRIDKETSGLLVVAASLRAHTSLVDQLQQKTMRREYFAIVRGTMTGGGTVKAPIGRHPRLRTKMAVVPRGGKEAVTHYRIAERFRAHTAIDVQLETGRTHQIRVHMAHKNHPLLGDPVYGGRLQFPADASEAVKASLRSFRRQALHARKLTLVHPGEQEEVIFESELATDLMELVAVLRADARRADP